jgi:hypothetical protein
MLMHLLMKYNNHNINNSVQFFMNLHAFSTAQRSIMKQALAKNEKTRAHKQRENKATWVI